MYNTVELGLWILCSYIIGSIPFSYAIPKLFKGIDISQHGSGNVGTTNVYRVLGLKYALPALILDIFKGGIMMYLASFRFKPEIALIISLFAVFGHCYSFMLKFKGGKGVATAAGILIVKSPLVTSLLVSILVIVVVLTRYVSLGSVLAAAALPFAYYYVHMDRNTSLIFACLSVFVILRHSSNIVRLLKGRENKIKLGGK